VAWVVPRSEVPLTCTGPHSRTHTMPIKHAVPPLTHAHNMCGAHTRNVHATCTPTRSAHTAHIRITCDFASVKGTHQGCPLGPALFCMRFKPHVDWLLGALRKKRAWCGGRGSGGRHGKGCRHSPASPPGMFPRLILRRYQSCPLSFAEGEKRSLFAQGVPSIPLACPLSSAIPLPPQPTSKAST
jgi:hypothetical protein